MKLLYEASNTVEAHMILNLLEQAGLSGRIDGEYLQSGVGELQAIGFARVMVDEADYPEAKKIIEDWDAKQPVEENKPRSGKKGHLGAGVTGFALGIAIMLVYYHTPVTHNGIDYNSDGVLDERWTYVNDLLSKSEMDRNFDGDFDLIYSFDRMGLIKVASADQDFNGSFETKIHYNNGNPVWQKSDTTGDGFKDYRIDFKHGLMEMITFISPATKKAIKVQKFNAFNLESAELDTNGDGVMDAFYTYDAIEEIAEKSSR